MTTTQRTTCGAASLILAVLLAACGGGGNAAPTASTPTTPTPTPVQTVAAGTWVVMGSSSAAGAGAPEGKGWAALLQAAYGARGAQVTNIAKGGSVSYAGVSASAAPVAGRPQPDPTANIDQALARKPVLLIVSYPTNDTALGYSADETVNNLLAIRAQALAAGVPVLLLSTQPRNLNEAQLVQLRMIDTRLAASVGACFVEVRAALAGADGRLAAGFDSGDGVHPNEAGHAVLAEQVKLLIEASRCVRFITR
jgi:lysophospholipase L1-like esterase